MISREITEVQKIFGKVFNAGTEFERDGSQFNRLLDDNDSYQWVAFLDGLFTRGAHSGLYGPHNWGCSFCGGYIIYA